MRLKVNFCTAFLQCFSRCLIAILLRFAEEIKVVERKGGIKGGGRLAGGGVEEEETTDQAINSGRHTQDFSRGFSIAAIKTVMVYCM